MVSGEIITFIVRIMLMRKSTLCSRCGNVFTAKLPVSIITTYFIGLNTVYRL